MEWEGLKYGGKRDSFVALRDLPQRVRPRCAIATDMNPDWDDHAGFVEAGRELFSAAGVCRSVDAYLRFIDASRGEIGVAKTG